MRGKFGRGGRRTGQFVWQAFILDEVSKLGKMWLLVRLFDIRRGDVAAATALHSLFTGERDMALLLARFLPFFLLFFTSPFTIDRFAGSRWPHACQRNASLRKFSPSISSFNRQEHENVDEDSKMVITKLASIWKIQNFERNLGGCEEMCIRRGEN